MDEHFAAWKTESTDYLKSLGTDNNPKEVIHQLAENLLQQYADNALIDKYDIYQHLMSYWFETMQDDCYIVSADGWKAETYRIIVKNKAKKKVDKGWLCDLVPKDLLINRYFQTENQAINQLTMDNEQLATEIDGLLEEHSSEDGYFAELEKVNKANVQKRLRQLTIEEKEEIKILKSYLDLLAKQAATNKKIREAEKVLDAKLYAKYPTLDEDEIKTLVVDDKLMQAIEIAVKSEIEQISQRLTNRIKELVERYETPLPVIDQEVIELEGKVYAHLEKMGFSF
jgi:type I restriction enzyme M protein